MHLIYLFALNLLHLCGSYLYSTLSFLAPAEKVKSSIGLSSIDVNIAKLFFEVVFSGVPKDEAKLNLSPLNPSIPAVPLKISLL